MNTITEACCPDCNHEWKCELDVVETMACPGCGTKPPVKPVTVPTEINAVTALYAFAGWLTSMEKPITFSSNHWATPAADMVAEMIKINNIGGVCDFDNIKTPSDFEYPVALDNGAVDVIPTFTQEMSEDKKLPPIGSWFIDIELSDEPVLSIAHDLPLKRVVYKRGSSLIDSEYFGAIASECKPISPPIELIDGECYQFTSPSTTIRKGYYLKERGLFISYKGNVDTHRCTNIQLLEVKS
ncbi:MAG: hypothetical protein JKY81_05730 [Colwellia sp.]|nr:hypothetical protein [Colwellia sp.]